MTLNFLRFTPVELRAQHNGWSPRQQLRFVVGLARGASVGAAAAAVGMTRQSAYQLRGRSGAESFAAAWDAAQAFARKAAGSVHRHAAAPGAIAKLLVPRYYRGRLVGFVEREDVAGAMRALGVLDRLANRIGDDPGLRAMSESLEAFVANVPPGFDGFDEIDRANGSTPSKPAVPDAGLTPPAAPHHPMRVRVGRCSQ